MEEGSWGVGLTLILSVGEGGGVKVSFCLVRGGCDLILSHISPMNPTPPTTPGNYCTVT